MGRVTQELLLRLFGTVDLLEPSKHLLDTAQKKLTSASSTFPQGHMPGKFFYQGLEKFKPEANRYDCLWLQWYGVNAPVLHKSAATLSYPSRRSQE